MTKRVTENPKRIILCAGGTGGHVFPALALAQVLIKKGYKVDLITEERGKTWLTEELHLACHIIRASRRKGVFNLAKLIFDLMIGIFQAFKLLRRLRPQVVVGFGGYAAFPTMVAALMNNVPIIVHEQNAFLGRTNRLIGYFSHVIASSFRDLHGLPASLKKKVVLTGMPIRERIKKAAGSVYKPFLPYEEIHIVVLGGSQGARALNHLVPQAIGALEEDLRNRLRITHQCRVEYNQGTQHAYDSLNVKAHLEDFFQDVPSLVNSAHLVICRAGASTIAELVLLGRPAIFIPLPTAMDDHQTFNAQAVVKEKGGWIVSEQPEGAEKLSQYLKMLLRDPHILQTAAYNISSIKGEDGAQLLCQEIVRLIKAKSISHSWLRG